MDSCFVWEVSIAYKAIVMDSCTHLITDTCCFFSCFFFFFFLSLSLPPPPPSPPPPPFFFLSFFFFFFLFFSFLSAYATHLGIYNHRSGFSSCKASMIMGSFFVWSEFFSAAAVQAKAVCIENGYIQNLVVYYYHSCIPWSYKKNFFFLIICVCA